MPLIERVRDSLIFFANQGVSGMMRASDATSTITRDCFHPFFHIQYAKESTDTAIKLRNTPFTSTLFSFGNETFKRLQKSSFVKSAMNAKKKPRYPPYPKIRKQRTAIVPSTSISVVTLSEKANHITIAAITMSETGESHSFHSSFFSS